MQVEGFEEGDGWGGAGGVVVGEGWGHWWDITEYVSVVPYIVGA